MEEGEAGEAGDELEEESECSSEASPRDSVSSDPSTALFQSE